MSRVLVLVVCSTEPDRGEVVLSDGWYAIRAALDAPLSAQLRKGNVRVGAKLAVCGAEVTGLDGAGEAAVDPLAVEENRVHEGLTWPQLRGSGRPHRGAAASACAPRLMLHANSTRPAV